MAYYNGYPAPYQQMMQQNYQQQGQQGGLIWVQGEAAAKSYLVAPGSTVPLWDSEEEVIYLKSADASGMPSMKILEYKIRGEKAKTPAPEYATKSELDALADKIREMKDEITGLNRRRRQAKGDEFDE